MSTRTCLKYTGRRLLRKQADGPSWLWIAHRDPLFAGSLAFCFYRTYATTNARESRKANAPVDAWQPQPTSTTRNVDRLSASTSSRQQTAKSTQTASNSLPKKTLAQQAKQKRPDEQIAEIEQLMNAWRLNPVTDIWGQKVQLLDVQIPYSMSLNPFKWRGNSWATTFTHVKSNFSNSIKNAFSMYRMASVNAFPGVHVPPRTTIGKFFRWPIHIFRCRSIKPDAWIAGTREQVLDVYKAVNKAVSMQDEKTLKRLTNCAYQDTAMKLLRKSKGADTYVWRLHDGTTPAARVLSIRAIEGNLSTAPPKIGNRLLVQALVKFDTMQSLQVYSKTGELLSSVQPKKVVEYLVLEKRMWYDGPWMIRDQVFHTAGMHV